MTIIVNIYLHFSNFLVWVYSKYIFSIITTINIDFGDYTVTLRLIISKNL